LFHGFTASHLAHEHVEVAWKLAHGLLRLALLAQHMDVSEALFSAVHVRHALA